MRRIFISHSSRDNAAAAALRARLEERGLRSLFLDFDPANGIPAGREWEKELYQRIRSCQAMVVVCSVDSMASRWCFMEITHARALGKPVFALKIDQCQLDGVLTDRQAIDLTTMSEAEGYDRLFRGMAAMGIDPAKTFPWDGTRPPYPGLLAFQEEDAAIFFGRGDEISQGLELLNRLHHLGDPRLIMVLGASGTGKSSLVRAGLMPRLRRDSDRWIVLDLFRPRADPTGELVSILSRSGSADLAERLRVADDPDALAEILLEIRRRSGRPAAKVLLIVDQFEELLGRDSSMTFLTQLRRAIDHPDAPVVVVATMRSDFLDRFQNSHPLLDIEYAVLSLGPMSQEDIAEIIEEPAKEAEVELEPRLVTALVADAGTPNALPLLAFTLRELFERYAGDRLLTLDEYQIQLGGMQEVVGKAADDALRSARTTREQLRALRAAFMAMVRITDDGKYARRAVQWDDLPESIHPLLARFVDARLLVSGADSKEIVEVAHERLFDSWKQLREWIAEDAEALRLREDIEGASRVWEAAKHSDDLWRGARVGRACELLDNGTLLLDDAGRRFIVASERTATVRRRSFIGLAVALLIVFASIALVAILAAKREKETAQIADERARSAEVARLYALSAQNFAEHQRVLARAQTAGIGEEQKSALLAIAPKYLDQSKRYEEEAKRLESELEAWRREKGIQRATPQALFTLEVLRAQEGTAFLVHYGLPGFSRHLLIDGGSMRTYRDVLQPRLDALRPSGKALPLRLVVATQTDMAHLKGLIDLMEDLEANGTDTVTIGALWSNAFSPEVPRVAGRVYSKERPVAIARTLGLPVNAPFSRMVAAPEAGAARVTLEDGLTITVLGPRVQWLREFADFWIKQWQQRMGPNANPEIVAAMKGYDILETFANPDIVLRPSPIEIVDPPNPQGRDRSVVNLGSIVLMLEVEGKRTLLTADATSDILLSALAQAGYTDALGNMDVDVLVLPHGGSINNVSLDFFRRVKARYYVMSSNGMHSNPRVRTFDLLFEARRDDSRPFSICLTYAPEEYIRDYPVEQLCELLSRERKRGTPFEIITPKKGQGSFGIDLWSNATFVDKGSRNGVCGL